jgi:hypothetical protein
MATSSDESVIQDTAEGATKGLLTWTKGEIISLTGLSK